MWQGLRKCPHVPMGWWSCQRDRPKYKASNLGKKVQRPQKVKPILINELIQMLGQGEIRDKPRFLGSMLHSSITA